MIDIYRERQRPRQREKQAPCREPDARLDPGSPGSHPGLQAALNRCTTRAAPRWLLYTYVCCLSWGGCDIGGWGALDSSLPFSTWPLHVANLGFLAAWRPQGVCSPTSSVVIDFPEGEFQETQVQSSHFL